ncbi:DUF5819 family protein [Nocardioides sp. LML1-1-1.1]|uniref:DUF5819 family protein n=1 Tax=Nocardioides sp. LML1-1-1.1 TaxID=3135248 RepID=UPI003449F75F
MLMPRITARRRPEDVRGPALGVRVLLWGGLAAVLGHSLVVALWVGPSNIARTEIGADRLGGYVEPLFDQAWSVFAPEADFRYDLVEVRGALTTDAGTTETGWMEVTAKEVAPQVRLHPFPSRTTLMSTRLAGQLQSAWAELSARQKEVAGTARQDVPLSLLGARLRDAATTPAETTAAGAYLRTETSLERFVGALARVRWGDRLTAIQFRTYALTVPRPNAGARTRQVRSPYRLISPWRPVPVVPAEALDAFRGYADQLGIE